MRYTSTALIRSATVCCLAILWTFAVLTIGIEFRRVSNFRAIELKHQEHQKAQLRAFQSGMSVHREVYDLSKYDGLLQQASLGLVGAMFFAATCYLIFIFRSHKNLAALGAENLRFTPPWAVGYHFVPVWNLVRPCQIVREIWYGSSPVSKPQIDCGRGRVRSHWLIVTWWTSFLLVCIVSCFALLAHLHASVVRPLQSPRTLDFVLRELIKASRVYQVYVLAILICAVQTTWLVVWIDARQSERAELLSASERPPTVEQ